MDGRDFFRQAVQELYDAPFPARKGPRLSNNKAARLARHEREQKKQKTDKGDDTTAQTVQATPAKSASTGSQEPSTPGKFVEHCIMNLPASAIDMLDAFQGLYSSFFERPQAVREAFLADLKEYSMRKSKGEWDGQLRLPMVHCYCFTKEVEGYEPDICNVSTYSAHGTMN